MNSKDITIILPVHDVSDDFNNWFPKSLKSLEQSQAKPGKLLIVCAENNSIKEYMSSLENTTGIDTEIVYNDGDTTYCGQINLGVSKCKTEYISVLEYDDEYSNIWFKQFDLYVPHYKDVDIFLPLVVDTDQVGQFLGFTNEALWAMGFSEEIGFLDNNALLKYQNFQVSGMIMKKDSFTDIGGMKDSMKLTFNYEFLLRATYNDTTIMTIPKIGYKHVNQRDKSLFWNYKFKDDLKIGQDEAKFWVETAKKEYFFTKDRQVEFAG